MATFLSLAECASASFLGSSPPPADIAATLDKVHRFISRHQANGKHVALLTSGGTTVPLEQKTVRYLDNFSSGNRGSASAEAFLDRGYAVIFLYRDTSLRPFQRHLMGRDFLDSLSTDGTAVTVNVAGDRGQRLIDILTLYQRVKEDASLLLVPFNTLFDYAHLLKALSVSLQALGTRALLFLAAAVADFYLPVHEMSEHKLSSAGKLQLSFHNTPKLLTPLRQEWAPSAFTITFKLETKEELLVPQARAARQKYGHQVVVANLLQSRRTRVTIVTEGGEEVVERGVCGEREIDVMLVDRLIALHSAYCME